jgi:hypothetical protein
MYRLALFAALLAACGSATDDRPATLEYITETILAPTCALAECHSAFKQQAGDVFDTPESVRRSIVLNGLAYPFERDNPSDADLIKSLTIGLPSVIDDSRGLVRMPFVQPMPDADIDLIARWIADGVPGAQCLPNPQNRGCEIVQQAAGGVIVTRYNVVECNDGNYGALVQMCNLNQVCDSSGENGQCVP